MPNAIAEPSPAVLLDQASGLRQELRALHERIENLMRSAKGVLVTLPELHDKATGRIDAQKVADFMGVPLKRLAEALGLNYKALHRNPAGESFQEALQPVKRVLELLHEFFPKPESARIWMNTPHPDLDGQTALATILSGKTEAVLIILENAAAQIPV
jgi:hypothetical protein